MKRAGSWDSKVYAAKLPETNFKGVTTMISLFEYKNGKKHPLN